MVVNFSIQHLKKENGVNHWEIEATQKTMTKSEASLYTVGTYFDIWEEGQVQKWIQMRSI
jgi:hypothetical protein